MRIVAGRRAFVALLLLGLAAAPAFPAGSQPQPQKTDLTVSAAISLKDALDEIKQAYHGQHPEVTIATNYGASGTLELQIEQGAPVDVFISAAPKQMDDLAAKGLLLEGTRRDLVRNEVVLIVPKDSGAGVNSFQDLLKPGVKKVALGEPMAVPAGKYAQEVLTKLGVYDKVSTKAVLAKDVRQVLTYVEMGDADAGIVYKTDALTSQKVRVVAEAPANSHSPVLYPAAVIKDSKNRGAAQAFENFLGSPKAQAIFQKYGFTIAAP